MLLEVIATNLDDVKKINKTNAHRIELVKDMKYGGLTPDYDLIKKACEISKLPIHVMVRRKWESFVYDDNEFKQLLDDIEFIKKTNAKGIVFGSLTVDGKINVDQLKQVVNKKDHLKLTFHKAFDQISYSFEKGYEILNKNNVDIVLTSGGKSFVESKEILKKLVNKKTNPTILIGGGVNLNNFKIACQISNNIHIGSLAKIDFDNDKQINIELINKLIKKTLN